MREKEKNMKKTSKKIMAALMAVMMLVGAAGMTSAYFTDHHAKVNQFTAGGVKTEFTEPKWDSTGKTDAAEVRPNMTIEKDPTVKNTGTSDCYTFISFRVPYGKIATVNEDGTGALDTSEKDMFEHSPSAGWVLVDDTKKGTDYHEYTYAYATGDKTTGTMTALAKNQSTPSLFINDKIKMVNAVEDELSSQAGCISLENLIFNIPVREYSIQTTDINGTDGTGRTAPADVWAVVKAQIDTQYKGMAEDKWGKTTGDSSMQGNDSQVHDGVTVTTP